MSNHVRIMYIHGFDISCTFRLHKGLPVMHDGLYAMCKGLPVIQRVCLSCAMTAIMIHMCHNDVMM